MRPTVTIVVVALLLWCTPAEALVLCAPVSKKTGRVKEGARPRLRTACQGNEMLLDPAAIGIQGPEGPQGPVGPPGPSGTDATGTTLQFVPGDGTPAENGAALVAALVAITDASADKRYTLRLSPGTYDVGAAGLDLVPFVDIEGSGREASILTGTGSEDENPFDGGAFGTVRTADATTLRALTVRNTGGAGTTAIGVLAEAGRSRLQDVVVEAFGGDTNRAVAPVVAGSDPIFVDIVDSDLVVNSGAGFGELTGTSDLAGLVVKDTTVTVTGGGAGLTGDVDTFGFYLVDGVTVRVDGGGVGIGLSGNFALGSQLVRNSLIVVTGGTQAFGFAGAGSGFNPAIESTRVQVSGASSSNAGISTNNGSPRVLASHITVTGVGATAVRIGSNAFAGNVEVSASILSATTVLTSVQDNPATRFRIAATQLAGSTVKVGTGLFVCTGAYTSTFTPLDATCS